MTVPVSESSDERNLRRLVDAINANAGTPNTSAGTGTASGGDNGGAKGSASTGGSRRSSRTPNSTSNSSSKSPPKKGSRGNGDPDPSVHRASQSQRSPSRKGQQASHVSSKGGRSRARTNDDAASRKDLSPAPNQGLGSRRATWTGSGGRDEEKQLQPSSERQEQEEGPARRIHFDSHVKRAATAAAPTSATATETRRVRGRGKAEDGEEEDLEDGGARGTPRGPATRRDGRGQGKEREPAGVGVSGERAAATLERPARRQGKAGREETIDARTGHAGEEEDSLPIEDRLQAVMKDLGVPSREHG